VLTNVGLCLAFQAPEEPSGMQALLEHSVQTYGPLPSDMRPRRRVRSRTSSRASPYPQTRVSNGNFNSNANVNSNFGDFNSNFNSNFNTSNASSLSPPSFVHSDPYATANTPKSALTTPVLREVAVNSNLAKGSAPSIEALKPFSPLVVDGLGSAVKLKANANNNANNNTIRPRVGSTARRTALGWSKRSTGPGAVGNGNVGGKKSTDQKENSIVVVGSGSGGVMMTCVIFFAFLRVEIRIIDPLWYCRPGDNLRLNRPRPKGRPTPGGRSGGGATPGSQLRPRSGIRV
jgi:serine/arginine repetitive matrix protein 2